MIKQLVEIAKWFHIGTSAVLLTSALAQALIFVLLARDLGASGMGRLAVMQAFFQLAFEFVSLGSGEALIQRVARDPAQYPSALGHALTMTGLSAVIVTPALTLIVRLFEVALSPASIGFYLFGELFGNRLTNLAEHAFIGHADVTSANLVRIISSALKLAAVVFGIFGLGLNELHSWILFQASMTILVGLICLSSTMARLGLPSPAFHRQDIAFGALIALTQVTRAVQFAVDRIVLALVAPPSIVAVYSAGARGVQVALIPIMAIHRNLFPHFFKSGKDGLSESRKLALLNLPKVVLVGLLAGALVIIGSNLFASILGPGFKEAASTLRWLSLVALFQAIQNLLADALTGASHQAWRTTTSVVGAIGYVGLIAVLTLYYGIAGLIVGIYLFQIIMIVIYAVLLKILAGKENHPPKAMQLPRSQTD